VREKGGRRAQLLFLQGAEWEKRKRKGAEHAHALLGCFLASCSAE
jgi:hypothetical protein